MGFLSGLGKILGIAGGAAFAPFTGGASLIPSLISAGGSVASGLAGGAQKGREAQNTAAQDAALFAQRENAAKENSLMGRAGLDLQQRGFGQQSQSDAYKKALMSALAMNMQDSQVSGVPKGIPVINFSGGMRPSAIGAEGKAAAGELQKQAMLKLMNGEKFDPLPAYQGTAAPVYKKPGLFENIMGGIGLGANAISGINAQNQQSDFQKKIMDAISSLNTPTLPGQKLPVPSL